MQAGTDSAAALPHVLDLAAVMLHELIHSEDVGWCYGDSGEAELTGDAERLGSGAERGACFPAGRTEAVFRKLLRQRYGV